MIGPGRTALRAATFAATLLLAITSFASFAETIRIGGTGAALGTMQLLGDAFVKLHPEHTVKVVPSLGSSGGVKALLGGMLEIAVSARDVKQEEREGGLSSFKYAVTPLVLAAHRQAPELRLTKESIADIFSGKTQNWPNGQPIRLVMRPRTESDTARIQKISPAIESAVESALAKPGMVIAITDADSADQIEKFPNSFGTSTLALILSESRTLKMLSVEGVMPSVRSLSDGTYPYFKDFYIVTSNKPSVGARQFVEFIDTAKGREILQKTGHLILNKK